MSLLKCPNCKSDMQRIKDPDMEIDRCEKCGGQFLDKGELNALATGMTGDIEFCSVGDFHGYWSGTPYDDVKPKVKDSYRNCPKPTCNGNRMKKLDLLVYSNTVFDYCEKCGGFFLDKSEVADMNRELASLNKDKVSEEFRGQISNHLVRLDKIGDVVLRSDIFGTPTPFVTGATAVDYLRLSVYFGKPLGVNLRISSEKWTEKFLKAVGLFKKQDIAIGHREFDSSFILGGDNTEKIKRLFSLDKVRDTLLQFKSKKFKIYVKPGILEIVDDRIIYTEGPYGELVGTVFSPRDRRPPPRYDVENDPVGIVKWMIQLATLMEKEAA